MKIIDLYVMVSKGEQPKKFKYRDEWWAYSIDDCDFRTLKQEYRDADMPTYEYLMCIIDTSNLNDEVEMIEDKEYEDIEKIDDIIRFQDLATPYGHNEQMFMKYIIIQQNKINALIRNQKYILERLDK